MKWFKWLWMVLMTLMLVGCNSVVDQLQDHATRLVVLEDEVVGERIDNHIHVITVIEIADPIAIPPVHPHGHDPHEHPHPKKEK